MVGAGLPQLRGLAGNAKSYAERLFDFPMVGPLSEPEAELAIVKPAQDEGVGYTPDAIKGIVAATRGYPYFLQEWGKHSWEVAVQSPITANDVNIASDVAVAAFRTSFSSESGSIVSLPKKRIICVRWQSLGRGPHRSGDIAQTLGKTVNSLGPIRQTLITKGMIWSPSHGDTAFTVPLFDEFMKRIMPGSTWSVE